VQNLLSVEPAVNSNGNIRKDKLFFLAGSGDILCSLSKAKGLLLLLLGGGNTKLLYDFNFAARSCRKDNRGLVRLNINSQTSVLFQTPLLHFIRRSFSEGGN
jgi:hypothetical protein